MRKILKQLSGYPIFASGYDFAGVFKAARTEGLPRPQRPMPDVGQPHSRSLPTDPHLN